MKNYIGLFCIALLLLPGCGGKKSKQEPGERKKGSFIPFFKDTKKQSSKRTKRALQENLDAFALENDALSENTFSLADQDMNLFAFDDTQEVKGQSIKQNNTPLFNWNDMQNEDNADHFQNLYFDFDKYKLADNEKPKLQKDIGLAKEKQCTIQHGDKKIVIEGHACHSAGSAAYNLALSEKRARNIAEEFMKEGIDRQNIKIAPRGQEMPLIHGGSKVEQAPNRRVEVFAIDSSPTKA